MKDLFSEQSEAYRQFRPVYPQALYTYLFSLLYKRERAWDVGTGNGQVAAVLADHMQEVWATDISDKQLAQAVQRPNIFYRKAPAETSPLAAQSVDLITVAQALHWFDFAAFGREVERVARPGALLAAWGYGLLRINPAVDRLIDHFYAHVLGPYWDPERRYIDSAYQTIPLPGDEIRDLPSFSIELQWTVSQLLGYLGTWSAYQHYKKERVQDPLKELGTELEARWHKDEKQDVHFPIFLRVFRL